MFSNTFYMFKNNLTALCFGLVMVMNYVLIYYFDLYSWFHAGLCSFILWLLLSLPYFKHKAQGVVMVLVSVVFLVILLALLVIKPVAGFSSKINSLKNSYTQLHSSTVDMHYSELLTYDRNSKYSIEKITENLEMAISHGDFLSYGDYQQYVVKPYQKALDQQAVLYQYVKQARASQVLDMKDVIASSYPPLFVMFIVGETVEVTNDTNIAAKLYSLEYRSRVIEYAPVEAYFMQRSIDDFLAGGYRMEVTEYNLEQVSLWLIFAFMLNCLVLASVVKSYFNVSARYKPIVIR
ncbi:MAG TPA: hypothetical protein DCL21_03340 [Alphaproteobacteria bacterium]|nr:hypothetical protein [Alphaproteobacteria bacterium]